MAVRTLWGLGSHAARITLIKRSRATPDNEFVLPPPPPPPLPQERAGEYNGQCGPTARMTSPMTAPMTPNPIRAYVRTRLRGSVRCGAGSTRPRVRVLVHCT